MAEEKSDPKKKYPFAAVSREQWQAAALSEWQGSLPDDSLKDGVTSKHYYDFDDLPEITNFQVPVSTSEFSDARSWLNMPFVSDSDDRIANQLALAALNSGADGILFELTDQSHPEILLQGIEFNYCGIAFLAGRDQGSFFSKLAALAEFRKYPLDKIQGCIFWKESKISKTHKAPLLLDWVNFHRYGILSSEKEKSSADSLAKLLYDAKLHIDDELQGGVSVTEVLRSIAFFVPAGTDFFPVISQFKALRMLWNQIAKSYNSDFSEPAYIHGFSAPWNNEALQPHSNLLKGTMSAMSAVLGGCDALTILPEKNTGEMMDRIARNISSILREEAYFSKVADPVAGSYYLENLTDQFAREVWKKFQQLL
jgi:methylmalonyl-CoA mutase